MYEEWRLFKYPAIIPYEPGYALRADKKLDRNPKSARNLQLAELKKSLGGQNSFPTVLEYLKAVQTLPDNDFKFQYAWWELPIPKWTLPPLAGVLMIGIAWPLALSAMQNYGMARRPVAKTKPKPAAPKPRPATNTLPAGVVIKPATPPAAAPRARRSQRIWRCLLPGGENNTQGVTGETMNYER